MTLFFFSDFAAQMEEKALSLESSLEEEKQKVGRKEDEIQMLKDEIEEVLTPFFFFFFFKSK